MRADSESHLYVTRPASETRRILKLLYEWLVLHVTPPVWLSTGGSLAVSGMIGSTRAPVLIANLMLSAPVARSERVMRIARDAMA